MLAGWNGGAGVLVGRRREGGREVLALEVSWHVTRRAGNWFQVMNG